MKAPIGSLVREGDRWTVFVVVVRDRAERTPIEIRQRNDTEAQVLKGLSPGAPVVAFPSDDIELAALVEPR